MSVEVQTRKLKAVVLIFKIFGSTLKKPSHSGALKMQIPIFDMNFL